MFTGKTSASREEGKKLIVSLQELIVCSLTPMLHQHLPLFQLWPSHKLIQKALGAGEFISVVILLQYLGSRGGVTILYGFNVITTNINYPHVSDKPLQSLSTSMAAASYQAILLLLSPLHRWGSCDAWRPSNVPSWEVLECELYPTSVCSTSRSTTLCDLISQRVYKTHPCLDSTFSDTCRMLEVTMARIFTSQKSVLQICGVFFLLLEYSTR